MGGGGKGGGGSNKASKTASKIAKDFYNQTDPLRQGLIGNYENFLGIGSEGIPYDVTQNPVWGAGRNIIEDQYGVARENVLSNVPRGGVLTDQLTNVESGRADAMGGLAGQIAQDEYNKLYGLATGAPQTSASTLSNLAGSEAMAESQRMSGKYGALGDIGMGTGMLLGGK